MSLPTAQGLRECAARLGCIVITPAGRGGSMLVQSLLDGHPELAVFPDVPLGWDYFDGFVASGRDIGRWLDANPQVLDSRSGFGDSGGTLAEVLCNEAKSRRPILLSAFSHIAAALGGHGALDSRGFMAALAMAWAASGGQDLERLQFLVFHHHNNRRVVADLPRILADFPRLRVLVTCRHPIESALSFKTLDVRNGEASFRNFSRNVRGWSVKAFTNVFDLQPLLSASDQLRLIDLGDLHIRQQGLLAHMCDWLGLGFDGSLLQATVAGHPWMGNSADGRPIATFDPIRARLLYPTTLGMDKGLDADEYRFTRYFTHKLLEPFGYDDPLASQVPEAGLMAFAMIAVRRMEWLVPGTISHDRGLKRWLRRLGWTELLLVAAQLWKFGAVNPVALRQLRL